MAETTAEMLNRAVTQIGVDLTPAQIGRIHDALVDLRVEAEFEHGYLECYAVWQGDKRIAEVIAGDHALDVNHAMMYASKAIRQLSAPTHPDAEVDAAYQRLNRHFLGKETTLQVYAPLSPGYRHTDDAPRIVEAAWWGDLLTVGRAAVQRYFHRPFTGFLECSHPETSIGKVDEGDNMETPHCLWCGDIQDMHTLTEHTSAIYSYITGGRISKPMTKPEEVIAVADDLETERTETALTEVQTGLDDALDIFRDLNLVCPLADFTQNLDGDQEKWADAVHRMEALVKKHRDITLPITIVVNGTPHRLIDTTGINYYGILKLAGFEAKAIRKVSYRKGSASDREGDLAPGQSVDVLNGMIFDATDTYPCP